MKASVLFAGLLAWCTAADAQFTTPTSQDLNTDPPEPQSTACGDIISANLWDKYEFFEASLAIKCLTSVPFNAAVATRFVAWYNQTLQFHTTPAFLRNPPQGYRQPSEDIFADLQSIQDRIDANYYRNQYVFDADIFQLIRGGHDGHLDLWAGVLSQFSWGAPFQIVSVSTDGKEEPKIYFWYNIKHYIPGGEVPSPIATINGVPVVEFLERYAAQQSFDMVEPHADWNQLMRTPAMQTMGYRSLWSAYSTFYPGDNLEAIYQNGTNYTVPWLALYYSNGFTGPLETGGDFYNFFVLDLLPASWNESYANFTKSEQTTDSQQGAQRLKRDSELTNWHSISSAYPADTISHQADLGVDTSGFVTGYYFGDISTAVVSIPSFDIWGNSETSFERAIVDFIGNATACNASKLIIDLQQNNGGELSLVFEAIRQLFPSISPPPTPSRMRSHPLSNYLGQTMTSYFQLLNGDDEEYDDVVSEEWVITDRFNYDTKQNFTSWNEFYGPLPYNGDMFSKIEEYNLSSAVFDFDALDLDSTPLSRKGTSDGKDPWSASDIVILTDGLCASACSLFVEIVTQQLGVRTVVVGGSPKAEPMQAASGTRGAAIYDSDSLDYDFAYADAILDGDNTSTIVRPTYLNVTGMYITYATINLRDQIRPANNGVPNQVLYLPANCRLYWTLANFNDYARLWHDVSDAIYKDQSICVGGYQTLSSIPSSVKPRDERLYSRQGSAEVSTYIRNGISPFGSSLPDPEPNTGVRAGVVTPPISITKCTLDSDCGGKGVCRPTTINCSPACKPGKPCQPKKEKIRVCAPRLDVGSTCSGTFEPMPGGSGKRASAVFDNKRVQGDAPLKGYCIPNSSSGQQPQCKA